MRRDNRRFTDEFNTSAVEPFCVLPNVLFDKQYNFSKYVPRSASAAKSQRSKPKIPRRITTLAHAPRRVLRMSQHRAAIADLDSL